MTLKLNNHDMIMCHSLKHVFIYFPRQILFLSEWMEWPKTFHELTGIKNFTIILCDPLWYSVVFKASNYDTFPHLFTCRDFPTSGAGSWSYFWFLTRDNVWNPTLPPNVQVLGGGCRLTMHPGCTFAIHKPVGCGSELVSFLFKWLSCRLGGSLAFTVQATNGN